MTDEPPHATYKGALSRTTEKLAHLNLEGRIVKNKIKFSRGGYGDVFTGIYSPVEGSSHLVAVKELRVHVLKEKDVQRRLAKELSIWSKLNHRNILPFYGFYVDSDIHLHLVSPWMRNGTVTLYLESNPMVDVVLLVKGIAEGIGYLHENNIIHSDIKPDNILISDFEVPLLCDFGVSRTLESSVSVQTSATNTARGTLRYMAKEVIHGEDGATYFKEADVWALGMTIYTILTKCQPYHHIRVDGAVMFAILSGKLPSWPEDNKSWPPARRILKRICVSCWREKRKRPAIKDISSNLDNLTKGLPRSGRLDAIHSQLKFDVCNIGTSYLRNRDIPGLGDRFKDGDLSAIKSASLNWIDHALLEDDVDALSTVITVANFFSSLRSLFWIEALSLLGEIETGKTMLQKLIDYFENEDQIVTLATEWLAFISNYHDAILMSAPHIYMSALSWGMPDSIRRLHERRSLLLEDRGICGSQVEDINSLNKIVRDAMCFCFSPDGSKFASGHRDGSLIIWDAVTGALIRNVKAHDGVIIDAKFSPDGRRIVTGSFDRTLRIWDALTGDLVVRPLTGHTYWVNSVAYSPDGARIVSSAYDRSLRIWDAQTSEAIGVPLVGHELPVMAISYSPDGVRIVSASDDKTLRRWDVHTGEQVSNPLKGHSAGITCVAYSADGSRIISGSFDKMVRIWDAKMGKPLGEPLEGHQGSVRSVAYSPDGNRIVSGSEDNSLRIWDARNGSAIAVIPRGESRWDSDSGCFLSIPSWWPLNHPSHESLIHSDGPTQIPRHGWLRTLDGGLFLWVPPKYRDDLCCRGPFGKIAPRLKFDWKRVPHGKDWTRVKEILEEYVDS